MDAAYRNYHPLWRIDEKNNCRDEKRYELTKINGAALPKKPTFLPSTNYSASPAGISAVADSNFRLLVE
ncbi:MAG: hypothetical protein GY792_16260 [Gammaproteobacteria bacterium]|nr:hypothetical protein [Gammaproteobacteria bacterium]